MQRGLCLSGVASRPQGGGVVAEGWGGLGN